MRQIGRISGARRRARKGTWSKAKENKASKSGPSTSFVRWTVAEASWEAQTPTSNQSPRGAQGCRLLGPMTLHACFFASLLGQARACLGPVGYFQRSGNGGPQTCLPAACGVAQVGAQRGPSSSAKAQDPRQGPSLAGRKTRSFLRHGLFRLAHERRRDQGGVPHEVPVTQAMTTEGARRVPARRCPPSLFGARGASAAAEYRGIRQRLPFRCNETKTRRTTRWRSPWSPRRRPHQSFAQAKTTFVRIASTSCPLSN